MFKADAYRTLRLQYGAPVGEVTRAWKRLVLEWHPDKNENSDESKKHTQRLNAARDMLITPDTLEYSLETYQMRRQRLKEEHKKCMAELLEIDMKLRPQEYARRLLWKQQEQALRRELITEKKALQVEARRVKAQATRREAHRRDVMIVVYQGPDLDQAFVVKHFYGLDVRRMKGGIVNSETGTKAVWLKFGRTLRRFTVREAIRVHNLSVEDQLKIQLLDQDILCGEGKRLL